MEVAITAAGLVPDVDVFEAAAGAGQLDMCEWLLERDFPADFADSFILAARGGHIDVCKWVLDQCDDSSRKDALREGCEAAAAGGHLGLMEMLIGYHPLPKGDDFDLPDPRAESVLEGVAHGCALPVLQRLHTEWLGPRRTARDACARDLIVAAAARSPTPDWRAKVAWLEALGYPRTDLAPVEAARLPNALGRLRWLWRRGYTMSAVAANVAAQEGNLAALQFLHARYCVGAESVREGVFRAAVGAGHTHVAVWCVEELGCNDVLAALQSAVDAVEHGSVEMLSWLASQGFRWRSASFTMAAESGCVAAVRWLREHGCRMPGDGAPYIKAATQGDLHMLRCLRRLGCPWGDGEQSADVGDLVADSCVLQWLREEGCTGPWLEDLLARNNANQGGGSDEGDGSDEGEGDSKEYDSEEYDG